MVGRLSIVDTMDVQGRALDSLAALEAEIILLLQLPEEQRSRLVAAVGNVRSEFMAAFSATASGGGNGSPGIAGRTKAQQLPHLSSNLQASGSFATSSPRLSVVGVGPAAASPSTPNVTAQVLPPKRPEHKAPHKAAATTATSTLTSAPSLPPAGAENGNHHQNSNSSSVNGPQATAAATADPAMASAVEESRLSPGAAAPAAASPALMPSPPPISANYGYCISAALYMMLEHVLVSCQADRLCLFAKGNVGSLQLAATAGAGVPPARRVVQASPVGILQAVLTTEIAANLDTVTFEDVAECPGPTAAKNALVFPVWYTTETTQEVVGVVMLVNKQRGAKPFNEVDESTLYNLLPSVGYLLHHYRLEYHTFPFDPAPLHRVFPLVTWAPPLVIAPSFVTMAPIRQRVFHRNGSEKFIRRQQLLSTEDFVKSQSISENLVAVETYLGVLEECWRRGIADRIDVEMSLRQKMQHLADAREILIRKQKKFEILKDTLCEQLEKTVGGGGGGGGGGDTTKPRLSRSITAR